MSNDAANASWGTLAEIVAAQRELQVEFGFDFPNMDNDARCEYVRVNVLAAIAELTEALNEVGWKPWATSRHFNEELFLGELTDVLHFLVNLYLVALPHAGTVFVADEIAARYFRKRAINRERRSGGYDGVATKCPSCTRALDDVTLHEFTITSCARIARVVRTCECGYALDVVDGAASSKS